jgi:hypothetical protein
MRFDGRAGFGRAKPPMVIVSAPNGSLFEVYLKSPNFHEKKSEFAIEREWVAAKLALALELPCAPPLKVNLSKAFIASVPDEQLRRQLSAGPEIVFGSLSAGAGWNIWTEAMALPRNKLALATKIYLFDTIIQNWDRCIDNANLLQKGDSLLLIDHEEAFVEATGTDAERSFQNVPWMPGAINNFEGLGTEHPLWRKLRPATMVDFKDAAASWKSLPEDAFALYAGAIPGCWSTKATTAIAEYLSKATQKIDEITDLIEYNYKR